MTRRPTRREIAGQIDALDDAGTDAEEPDRCVIRREVVDTDGTVVDTREMVFEI